MKDVQIFCGVLSVLSMLVAGGPSVHAGGRPADPWICRAILDSQTRTSLATYEKFFDSLFKLPAGYERATAIQKKRQSGAWLDYLDSGDSDKMTEAAACLGMVRAKAAARPLERLARSGQAGRIRWVCTRSLGQIGDVSSIPVLIDLIDDRNRNTQVYARVGLAEITGIYLGEDKEKWRDWRKYKADPSLVPPENATDAPAPSEGDLLAFHLPDSYGRIVDAKDYANVPVLVMSGSCWCGGCQQDAEPLRKIAAQYAPRGLQTIRTVAGDNELAALDSQKHYRLGFVQLLDTDRAVEKRYNRDGWTFLMLADRTGKIVYRVNSPQEKDWSTLTDALNRTVAEPVANETVERDGVAYMPETLRRSGETQQTQVGERFPSVACGPDGRVHVVFTTNRNGSGDIYYRLFDGATWSQDRPLVATDADEYDGTVLVDRRGQVWVCWTSDAAEGRYNVFVTPLTDLKPPPASMKLTRSDGDAMHGRMACDDKGRLWAVYYKWHTMGRYSRDKEVYLRRLDDGRWSDEMQISPTDVPRYEDHTEPAICGLGPGVVAAWNWDFHPPNKGYSSQAQAPTIFVRGAGDDMSLSRISCVSGKDIDVTPAIVAGDDGRIWCAWDSLSRSQRKSLCVAEASIGRDSAPGNTKVLSESVFNVCSPCFAKGPGGRITLVWCDTADGKDWRLKRSDLAARGVWSVPSVIETAAQPRFCSAAYDSRGRLWIACSAETDAGRRIVVLNPAEPN